MNVFQRVACLGGIYSNYLALQAVLEDIAQRQVQAIYCLGDLGAFGPYPDRVFPLLQEAGVFCLQGNYDDSIGNRLDDCQCGYTDPRDNHFAQLSYDYTLARTSEKHREILRGLPVHRRLQLGTRRVLLCHGSPRKVNEFLWQSATSSHFLQHLCDEYSADVIAATHTGIKWHRPLGSGRHFVNVGAIGRPENDGRTEVWYTLLEACEDDLKVRFVPVAYDHTRLAREIRAEGLPDEFAVTIETGWWTTCLEILPGKERAAGQY
jgi:predicted phosphodiesterase